MKVSKLKILDEEVTCWEKVSLRNTFFLNLQICLCKVLGIHPLIFENRKPLTGKIYSIILFGLLVSLSIWSGFEIIIEYSSVHSTFQRILSGTGSVTVIIYFANLLVNSLTKNKSWKNLRRNLVEFDEFFINDVEKCDGQKWKISLFILFRLSALSLMILDQMFWYEKNKRTPVNDTNAFWALQLGLLYQILISLLFKEFSEIVKSRYDYLHQYVKIILQIHVDNNVSKVEFHKEIQKVQKMYKLLFNFLESLNDIFGNVLIGFFMLILAVMLSDISVSLNYVNLAWTFDMVFANVVFWSVYLVSFQKTIYQVL